MTEIILLNLQYSLGFHTGECRAFFVDGQQVGLVRPDIMKELLKYPQVILYFEMHINVKLIYVYI